MANYPQTTTSSFTSDICITNGGKVGIGTASPSGAALHIVEDTATVIPLRLDQTQSTGYSAAQFYNSGTIKGHVGYGNASCGNTGLRSKAFFGTISNDDAVFTTNDQVRMTIDRFGRVGIGTTVPVANLDVEGWISIKDGVSHPSSVVGKAQIYVDSTSGDLKIIFGNGTIRTIVTD